MQLSEAILPSACRIGIFARDSLGFLHCLSESIYNFLSSDSLAAVIKKLSIISGNSGALQIYL